MKTILLVDDSKTALLMEQMILKKKGCYRTVLAFDGADAVAKAVAEKPDLILMDVIMPKMTGFEAVRELRQREETKTTPIIMVTTRGEAPNVETGYQSGCNDYLTKPIDAVALLAKIHDYLGE